MWARFEPRAEDEAVVLQAGRGRFPGEPWPSWAGAGDPSGGLWSRVSRSAVWRGGGRGSVSEGQVEPRPRWGVAISRDSKGRWGLRSKWGVGAWVAQEDRLYWGPRSQVAEDAGE